MLKLTSVLVLLLVATDSPLALAAREAHSIQWLFGGEGTEAWVHRANPKSVRSSTETRYDYVIIVEDANMVAAVDPLKRWKNRIGHSVSVVTLDHIYATYSGCYAYGSYSGCDKAAKIWDFLHEKYPASTDGWGIRYLLLVGDIDVLPMRILFPDGAQNDGSGYGSDFYYAKPSMASWDVDGDGRWGEFTEDNLDPTADLLVGRLPFNDPTIVSNICNNIVDFEKDTGAWKRNALLAHGILDYTQAGVKTDSAYLAQLLKQDMFDLQGWNYSTLYEEAGIEGTIYGHDYALSQTNFENQCGLKAQSIVNVVAHGRPDYMTSSVWSVDADGDGRWDGEAKKELAEKTETKCSEWSRIEQHPVSAVVYLSGCETGNILKSDLKYPGNTNQSRHLVGTPFNQSMVKEYLEHGAVAVIGATAGSDYENDWNNTSQDGAESLNYFYYDRLINEGFRVGDAFYEAHLDYVDNIRLQRGIRVFNYFGDPSLVLPGIADRPGGRDVQVHDGYYRSFAADNSDDGTMFVAVITTAISEPGEIKVYKSSDHGESWSPWNTASYGSGFYDVEAIADDTEQFVLAFATTADGQLWLYRFPMDGGEVDEIPVKSYGPGVELRTVSASRNVVSYSNIVHLAYSTYERSGDDYAIHTCRTFNQGGTWVDCTTFEDYDSPSIEVSPAFIFLAARKAKGRDDIFVTRSSDAGEHWSGPWLNLTADDGASQREGPVVAASSNPAAPAVWVAYGYMYEITPFRTGGSIRYAHSQDGGTTWTYDEVLDGFATTAGADNAGARSVHIKAYKASANQWVNAAYNSNPGFKTQAIWRYSDGLFPNRWSPPRIVNDFDIPDIPVAILAPRIVYSPGAPATGGGVVYGTQTVQGLDSIYFSAPWLADTLTIAEAQHTDVVYGLRSARAPAEEEQALQAEIGNRPALAARPTMWQAAGELEGAFAVSSILETDDGVLYASAIVSVDEATNEGVVYRSVDGGETWQRSGDLEAWSLGSLLLSSDGYLIAGGMLLDEGDAYGVIYLSEDKGDSWTLVHTFADGVVSDLMETATGDLYAATGWNGRLFRSKDGKDGWVEVVDRGPGVHIHSSIEAANGYLFMAHEGPLGGGILVSHNDGQTWTPAVGLDGVSAVYDLLESGDKIYAGTSHSGEGRVYRSDLNGLAWTATGDLPNENASAVRSLAEGAGGEVYAGTIWTLGPSFTRVYVSRTGGASWESFGGTMDLASTVNAMIERDGVLYAATGHVYGNVYQYREEALTFTCPWC